MKFSGFMTMVLLSFVFMLSFSLPVAHSQDMSDCKKCHVSDPKLDGKIVHAAVGIGCNVCHSEAHNDQARLPQGLSAEVPQLCFNCHDNSKFTDKVVHMPVGGGMCAGCHDPHSSDIEKLLTAAVPGLCFNCHQQYSGKVVHAPVAAGMCSSCHAPHAGGNESLLLNSLNDLCLNCHADVAKGPHVIRGGSTLGHPLSGEKDPAREGQPFNCVSCHDPHSSESMNLVRYNVNSSFALCQLCHKK